MLNRSHEHLQEIAEILASAILRIEAAPLQENEKSELENEIALDFYADSSVTVDRLMRPE